MRRLHNEALARNGQQQRHFGIKLQFGVA